MRGNKHIINSKEDRAHSHLTDEQIITMATIVVRYDDAVYPEDYDKNLKVGDVGFVEPIDRFENEIDQVALDRFGITI